MVEAKGCIVLDVSKEEGGGRREYIATVVDFEWWRAEVEWIDG